MLHPLENPVLSIDYQAGWALELVWTFWRRQKFVALLGFETWTVQLIP
jgi:hypothetical protein